MADPIFIVDKAAETGIRYPPELVKTVLESAGEVS